MAEQRDANVTRRLLTAAVTPNSRESLVVLAQKVTVESFLV